MMSAELARLLPPAARAWLDDAERRVRLDPLAVEPMFPVVGHTCGRDALVPGWQVDDAVRALLLAALPLTGQALADLLAGLYRYGGAAEKRGVLKALTPIDADGRLGPTALPLVEDAIRTHDTSLIAAALGEYGARHLCAPSYRHAVLKCVFTEIPLAQVAGLDVRADEQLARMLAAYAVERRALARPVPADVWPVIAAYPKIPEVARLLAANGPRDRP